MKRGQLLIVIVAAIAVAAVAVLSAGGDDQESSVAPVEDRRAPAGAVRIPFAYSPEKEKLLVPLIREFNKEDGEAFVEGEVVSSGEAQTRIAEGRYEPVVWSPA